MTDEAVIDEEELAEAPTLISEIEAFLKSQEAPETNDDPVYGPTGSARS